MPSTSNLNGELKVGDRVLVVETGRHETPTPPEFIGATAEVTYISPYAVVYPVKVRFDNAVRTESRTWNQYNFSYLELELLDPKEHSVTDDKHLEAM